MKRLLCVVIFVTLTTNRLLGQDTELNFDHINYDEVFSPSTVTDITQSKKGFLWIGTDDGIFRYDGYGFNKYAREKNPKSGLSNNHINVIFEDSRENLWVGTYHGVNVLLKNSNCFTQIDVINFKGGRNFITSIIEDNKQNIWIGTLGGVKHYNPETKLLDNIVTNTDFILNRSRVLSLFFTPEYGLIAGTSDGIQLFDPETKKLNTLPEAFLADKEFLKAKIWKITKEENGDLWFATETNGVYHYNVQNKGLTQYSCKPGSKNTLSSNWVNDIIIINENTIWFATKNGLCIFNKKEQRFTQYNHDPLISYSITDNDVKCFFKDRTGCIWVGTTSGGLDFYNKAHSNFFRIGERTHFNFGLSNPIVCSAIKENKYTLWAGTHGGGLNYIDIKTNTSESYLIDSKDPKSNRNFINVIANKDRNQLLCGTNEGLFAFDKNNKIFKQIPILNKGTQENVRPITSLVSENEEIWVGTEGNGLKHILKDGTVESYKNDWSVNSLSDNFISDIENLKDGLWVATQNGLNYFDKTLKKVTKTYQVHTNRPIRNNSLVSLFIDSKKRLWVGADYYGLFCLNETTDTFYVLDKENGFTDAAVKSITEDSKGNLWVASEDFLYKITINRSDSDLTSSDLKVTKFTSKDGISVKQFYINSAEQLNQDQLVFGGSKGLLIFNPEKVNKLINDGEIVLTKLIINNEVIDNGNENSILEKPISETSEITINYDQGYVGLEFSSFNFIDPKRNVYSYKLDSSFREDQWHTTGTQNRIYISNLSPGNYTFSIRSTTEEKGTSAHIKTLKINVLPPWWRTWSAYLAYSITLGIIIFIIIRFINNRVQLKRKLFMEHLENERKQETFNMQLNFFTNISHEIRTPLTLIKGPVEELLTLKTTPFIEERLKMVQQNSNRLLKLVNELLEFRKAEKGYMKIYCEKQDIVPFCLDIYETFKGIAVEKHIEYKLVLNSNTIPVFFDKNQLEKVIYNLLSNAFKFTKPNGKIVFAVEEGNIHENKVFITIKDNGIGIPQNCRENIFERFFQGDNSGMHQMGSGIGLALSKSIMELHKGDIVLLDEHESWASTAFQISLPLGKKHLSQDQIIETNTDRKTYLVDSESKLFPLEHAKDNIISQDIDEESNPDKKTILLIEDNKEVRKFIFSVLQNDYHILEFPNGKEAINYMQQEIPDLIISDIMMPQMDGLELCKYIKSNESTNHIPVILLTARASTDHEIEGLSTGADAYISKPFSVSILKLNIINLLSHKEILRQKYSGSFILSLNLDKLVTPEEKFIKKLMNIIEENLENPDFDVNMIVNEIGMSRAVLYKKVNALTNHSVASLIKHFRLKKASMIILNTTYTIAEVACLVGFNDRKHFSKEFKKVYNMSPIEFKNAQQNTSLEQ